MEKPIRNDYVEMDEDSSGNLRGCLDEDAYIDALEKYIDYLELQLKNLPNELRAVNRNEQAEEFCRFGYSKHDRCNNECNSTGCELK
jgi:hypothetical protein